MLTTGAALAERIRCKGGTCNGTELADVMSGTFGVDKVFGLGGNDDIVGKGGDDTLNGGAGDDLMFGESGIDTLIGGIGSDRLHGNDGGDTFFAGDQDDFIDTTFGESFPEKDTIDCGPGPGDTVIADFLDTIVANCEKVTRK